MAPTRGHPEDLADLGLAGDDLLELGGEHADHGVLDVLEELVDDLVGADLDVLGSASSRALRSGRTLKPMIVALEAAASWMSFSVMPPTPRCTNASLTSSRSSFWRLSVSASSEPVTSALRIRLSVAVSPAWICSKMSSSRAPPDMAWRLAAEAGHAAASARGSRRTLRAVLLVGGDDEVVAGVGDVGQAEDLDRRGRPGFLDLLALVVDERPHPAPGGAGDDRVADLERAALHEHGGDRAPADVEVGLEHDAPGAAVGAGPQVLELGDDEQVLEQVVDAEALQRRDLDHDRCRRPTPRARGRARRAAACTRFGSAFSRSILLMRHDDRAPRPPWRGRSPRWSGA